MGRGPRERKNRVAKGNSEAFRVGECRGLTEAGGRCRRGAEAVLELQQQLAEELSKRKPFGIGDFLGVGLDVS